MTLSLTIEINRTYPDDPQTQYPVRVVEYDDPEVVAAGVGMDEVVILAPTIRLMFDYPLSVSVTQTCTMPDQRSWTRKDLWGAITDGYKKIYAEEDAAVGPTGAIPGMENRATSNGPYGIWGHSIDQLYIEGVTLQPATDAGPLTFRLSMGS